MNELPKRKGIRLKDYDYSENGCYFITICTYEKQNLFEMTENDDVIDSEEISTNCVGNDLCVVPQKNLQNHIIEKWLTELQNKFSVKMETYAIMPNHIHLLLTITERHAGRSLHGVVIIPPINHNL